MKVRGHSENNLESGGVNYVTLSYYLHTTMIITQQIFPVKPLPSHISFLVRGKQQEAMCMTIHIFSCRNTDV